jgi:hypothetical protein
LASFFYIKNKNKNKNRKPLFPGYIEIEDNVACRIE